MAELLLAAVAVGRPVRGEFTYLVPEQLAGRLLPGQRIRVPFGRGSALGFYLGPAKERSAEAVQLKPIERELEREPSLPPDLVSLLRFAAGRPVSALTEQYLDWVCQELEAAGKRALLLIWDNAPWHTSGRVRAWIRAHNRQVKRAGKGVRLVVCWLPTKSPWLNNIEPKWVHGKRAVAEPDRVLATDELIDRVFDYYGCARTSHLSNPVP